jgi:hypothetical protein
MVDNHLADARPFFEMSERALRVLELEHPVDYRAQSVRGDGAVHALELVAASNRIGFMVMLRKMKSGDTPSPKR